MEILKGKAAFKLKNGTSLVLDGEDYNKIVLSIKLDVILALMRENPGAVYFEKDLNEGKITSLYKILNEQKATMTDEMKTDYLRVILELSQSNDKTVIQTKDEINPNK